jgi:hypothetical protein
MSKNYEICTTAKLIARCMFTKSFKKSKNKMRSSDTALVTPGTFSPLGVNICMCVSLELEFSLLEEDHSLFKNNLNHVLR